MTEHQPLNWKADQFTQRLLEFVLDGLQVDPGTSSNGCGCVSPSNYVMIFLTHLAMACILKFGMTAHSPATGPRNGVNLLFRLHPCPTLPANEFLLCPFPAFRTGSWLLLASDSAFWDKSVPRRLLIVLQKAFFAFSPNGPNFLHTSISVCQRMFALTSKIVWGRREVLYLAYKAHLILSHLLITILWSTPSLNFAYAAGVITLLVQVRSVLSSVVLRVVVASCVLFVLRRKHPRFA
jgi:hypothetical protein